MDRTSQTDIARGGGFEDLFGASVELDGDLMVVGEPRWEPAVCHFGRAYVFRREGPTWVEEATLLSPGSQTDCFGWSVGISGDRIVVGALDEAFSRGRVYVYRREGMNWVLEDTLAPPGLAQGDGFGGSVAIDGDLLVGGAGGDDGGGTNAGSAYVFRRVGTSWVQEAKLTASDAASTDFFGTPVSIDSESMLIGATGKDGVGTNSGAAYVFRANAGTWVEEQKLVPSDAAALDAFGWSVAIEGDLAVVGAPGDDGNSGSGYLFKRSGTIWVERDKLLGSEDTTVLGASSSVDRGLAVVGARGAAYVFAVTDPIPTVSAWGMVILGLLLLTAGTIVLRDRLRHALRATPKHWGGRTLPVLGILLWAGNAGGQTPDFNVPHHPERLLVRFVPGTSEQTRQLVHAAVGTLELKTYRHVDGLVVVKDTEGDLRRGLRRYVVDDNVLYAELDYQIEFDTIPDDEYFADLWGMHNIGQTVFGNSGTAEADINATEAWDIWTGDPNFRIGVVDTGVDYTHEDFFLDANANGQLDTGESFNVWVNPGEDLNGNGLVDGTNACPVPNGDFNCIDDDGNGWVDDLYGYDFGESDADPAPNTQTANPFHGTHVAGTIGAMGNNALGVVGVNWRSKIVALKLRGPPGQTSQEWVDAAIEAIDYMTANGIKVSNHSWGVPAYSQALADVIIASQSIGHILVVSAGNQSKDVDVLPPQGDPHFPCFYSLPNVICVAATNNDDGLASFSNYGVVSVDLGAPGHLILSMHNPADCGAPTCGYKFMNGTSFASPHLTSPGSWRWPGASIHRCPGRPRGSKCCRPCARPSPSRIPSRERL